MYQPRNLRKHCKMIVDKELLQLGVKTELARREFWYYTKLMASNFYREDRPYLKSLCYELQNFMVSNKPVMIINIPPRHGKSRTASLFVEWILGNDPMQKIMTGSYNETLSSMFSKNVRNDIMQVKADVYKPIFRDVFPNVRIKRGDGAMNLWSLEGGYNSYLATSPTGTATGFGASLLIIDDIIKSAQEAYNEGVKEKHWEWFTNTLLSRLEEGGKILLIMTRWAGDDLTGRVANFYQDKKIAIQQITMPALLNEKEHKMLCPSILTYETYQQKIAAMGVDIASANYQQVAIDIRGRLYTSFKTYERLPVNEQGKSLLHGIYSYCDTADAGDDYLCHIVFGVYNHEAYVLDVVFTHEPMEITEPLVAKSIHDNKVNKATIESNNGGKGFARNVFRHLQEDHQNYHTGIKWKYQSKNKIARILTNATYVMQHIYYPVNWMDRWPDYYRAMSMYQREGKNKHDDAPDATTGIVEMMIGGNL